MLVVCLWAISLSGCAEQGTSKSWGIWPFNQKTTDVIPGIPSPAERMASLRKTAKEAAKLSQADQEKISEELRNVYRQEDDPLIRAEIVHTMGCFQTEAATAVLRLAINDANNDVRIAACRAWGKRHDAEAVDQLGRSLGSDVDVDVRLAAIEALGATGQRSAVPALGQALEDRDPAMQYRAIASLRKVSDRDLGNDVDRWRQYVKGETPGPEKPVSVVDRFRRMF